MTARTAVRVLIAATLGGFLLALAGCGESPQVVNYKQGTYQGKPDTPAWKEKPWNGSREQWNIALDTRAQNQNESKRIR